VTIPYDKLMDDLRDANLVGENQELTPAQARQLACDADILPAVLGGQSEILDLGRAARLASPAQRAALQLRDKGCVFAGCGAKPNDCHTHHIQPWAQGGTTSLDNLVSLCP
jgi:hypothetical protein